MADDGGSYSGVTYSTVDVGYTSAEGYTGVIATQVPVGYTGSAPAPTASAPEVPMDAVRFDPEFRPMYPAPSPYEVAVSDAPRAPGGQAALKNQPSFPVTVDVSEFRDAREDFADVEPWEQPPEDEPIDQPIEQSDTARAALDLLDPGPAAVEADAFVHSYMGLLHRLDSRQSPEPDRAMQTARDLLAKALELSPRANDRRLLGWRADEFDRQVSRTLAADGASQIARAFAQGIGQVVAGDLGGRLGRKVFGTLGGAYLVGIGEELASTTVHTAAGIAAMSVDPLGAGVAQATQLLDAINARMDAGDSVWGAVDYVLDPFTRYNRQIPEANRIAGLAAEAWRVGNYGEAWRLALASGRAAASVGVTAIEVFTTTTGAVGGAAGLGKVVRRRVAIPRSPRPPRMPPGPVSETKPLAPPLGFEPLTAEPPPGSRGVTGTVVHDTVPEVVASPRVTRPHATYPQIPVTTDPTHLALREWVEQNRLLGLQQTAEKMLGPLTSRQRLNRFRRMRLAAPMYRSLERLSAIRHEVLHPGDGVLTQARILGVLDKDGVFTSVTTIPVQAKGARKGAILDQVIAKPGGRWFSGDTKTVSELRRAYSSAGGLTETLRLGYSPEQLPAVNIQGVLRPASKLRLQQARINEVIDFAKAQRQLAQGTGHVDNAGLVVIEGYAGTGQRVPVQFDPDNFGGPYGIAYGTTPE